jgi:AcrR family transcriptional regulator
MPQGRRGSGSATSTRGRPRRAETDRSIHEAALRILRDKGPAAVTVEAVAAESGVAKTTIYRRHPDREAVLRSAFSAAITPPTQPVGETPRERIRWAMDETWRQMSDLLGRGGLAAILGNTNPAFTRLFRSVLTPYGDALVRLMRADVAAGELRGGIDPDAVVSLLIGAYLGELVRRGSVEESFQESCADLVWAAIQPADPRSIKKRST